VCLNDHALMSAWSPAHTGEPFRGASSAVLAPSCTITCWNRNVWVHGQVLLTDKTFVRHAARGHACLSVKTYVSELGSVGRKHAERI
jgi:hypothetical protein